MVSLQEEKARKLAQVVGNESCRRILEHLTEKEATESELSEKLDIPISTVHYNLKQLVETGLISSEEFHYSKKGREVSHYKLANKYIIIAPKSIFGIKEKLKSILPVALIVAGASLIISLVNNYLSKISYKSIAQSVMVEKSSGAISQISPASITAVSQNLALWFFIGGLFALVVYLVVGYFRRN